MTQAGAGGSILCNCSTDIHVQMNNEHDSGHGEENMFAVNFEWFRAWQQFVRGDSEGILQSMFFGCIECMRCRLLLPVCVVSVHQSVCHVAQLGFTVRGSFGAAFAKSL